MNRLAKVGPNAAARTDAASADSQPPERQLLSVGEAATRLGTDKERLRAALSHHLIAHKVIVKRRSPETRSAAEQSDDSPIAASQAALSGKGVRVPVELLEEIRLLMASLPDAALAESVAENATPIIAALPESTSDDNTTAISTDESVFAASAEEERVEDSADPGEHQAEAEDQKPAAPYPEHVEYTPQPEASMPLSLVFERLLMEKDARIDDLKAEIEHLRGVLEREQGAHARTQTLLSLQAPPPEAADASPAAANPVPDMPQPTPPEPAITPPPLPPPAKITEQRGLLRWMIKKVLG